MGLVAGGFFCCGWMIGVVNCTVFMVETFLLLQVNHRGDKLRCVHGGDVAGGRGDTSCE